MFGMLWRSILFVLGLPVHLFHLLGFLLMMDCLPQMYDDIDKIEKLVKEQKNASSASQQVEE